MSDPEKKDADVKCELCESMDIEFDVCEFCDGTGDNYDPSIGGAECFECDGTGEGSMSRCKDCHEWYQEGELDNHND